MIDIDILLRAFRLMCFANQMTDVYEANRQVCRYVHSTSRGHEAIQLATAFQLLPCDFVSPYYRDESLLLGLGFTPYELMLQLLAKKNDPFSGGREYYAHPSYRGNDKPGIIHQSSATGMQVIPTTGIAQGIQYLEKMQSPLLKRGPSNELPLVVCSMGDASVTEGEVSEAFQFAVLKQLPVIYLVQDNRWGISVTAEEARTMDAYQYAEGFPGMHRTRVNGSDFEECFTCLKEVISDVRINRRPWIIQASVPLLSHHTSGVRKEFYRDKADFELHVERDPFPRLRNLLINNKIHESKLIEIEKEAVDFIRSEFQRTVSSPEPDPAEISNFIFAPTPVIKESGERSPSNRGKVVMVDAALFAIRELMHEFPEAVLYGQDVGRRLGGVFREAATLGEKFGDHRVFNTAIQEAYIIGSTAGMSAVGVKPIVEIQFADYIYPGINQLASEISKSCYLTCGKYPVQTLIRIPVGAYGGGGPYHSGSIESTLLAIKGIKVAYPSNAADMKGLMKAAFLDPNPVVMLEHKGLYWSKVPGTDAAKTIEPAADYILPLGKGMLILQAEKRSIEKEITACIITYGMGVYWSIGAAKNFNGKIDIVDLRTLYPLDEELIYHVVSKHGRCLIVTEEQQTNSFAEALAGRISRNCFTMLDAPVEVIGSLDLPAVPMNIVLEHAMLPGVEKITAALDKLIKY